MYSFFFEIITKWSVSHHFKKSKMTCITYLIYIDCPNTFLDIKKSLSQLMLFTREIWNKLLHSCNSKHSSTFFAANQWTFWKIHMMFWQSKLVPCISQLLRWYVLHFFSEKWKVKSEKCRNPLDIQIPSFLVFSFSLLVILIELFKYFVVFDTIDEFIQSDFVYSLTGQDIHFWSITTRIRDINIYDLVCS